PRGSRPLRPVPGGAVPSGQDLDLPAAAGGDVHRSGGARARDPDHRPARARPLLRHRRGAPRRPGLRVGSLAQTPVPTTRSSPRTGFGNSRPVKALKGHMRTLESIHKEIEELSERRVQLWHTLSDGYDAESQAEVRRLEERLEELWQEQR